MSETNRTSPPLEDRLEKLIRDRLSADPRTLADSSEIYRAALNDLVDDLLCDEQRHSMSAEAVGKAYERLRGLRLEIDASGEPRLVPTAGSKRNQGLFYTPQAIVSYIVASTLDALELSKASDYLALRVLDPAVGAGTFLAEALEQLAARALSRSQRRNRPEPGGRYDQRGNEAAQAGSEEERAVRLHILEKCLYGLDLDQTALKIAHAVLTEGMSQAHPERAGMFAHVRHGNALMGAVCGQTSLLGKDRLNHLHAEAYFGKDLPEGLDIDEWSRAKGVFHWPLEFPEITSRHGQGFHAVIGNPPYEIVSVKESGIEERHREQRYFRRMYRTCTGKINTYRLMLERGLDLLADRGALGFIVPATFLADSTAAALRTMLLDGFSVCQCVVIPEKARVFEGVTQAFAIIVVRKDRKKTSLFPVVWDGTGQIPEQGPVEIPRSLIDAVGLRIPILKSEDEKKLLEHLSTLPPLRGDERWPRAGAVHQGEINLTVHRRYITEQKTSYPLIRGEHVQPFCVRHPAPNKARLDWVKAEFFYHGDRDHSNKSRKQLCGKDLHGQGEVSNAWEKERIAVGRVVNMDTRRRLKAAAIPPGHFLGDMTNSISDLTVPREYLLGLLNSRLLNWRFKLTSTNNYISAAEIECLPIPRTAGPRLPLFGLPALTITLGAFLSAPHESVERCVVDFRARFNPEWRAFGMSFVAKVIEHLVESMVSGHSPMDPPEKSPFVLLDSLVLLLYDVEWAVKLRDLWEA